LIPPDLKDSLLNQDRVVFILDDVTANYPWELMIATDMPLCVCMGMIRQLETVDYEERVRDTTSTNVYVVGDPLTPSNYPELHGARKEADLVASLLKEYQFTVNHSGQRLGCEVLNQLLPSPIASSTSPDTATTHRQTSRRPGRRPASCSTTVFHRG
jgi:hypothetical protein